MTCQSSSYRVNEWRSRSFMVFWSLFDVPRSITLKLTRRFLNEFYDRIDGAPLCIWHQSQKNPSSHNRVRGQSSRSMFLYKCISQASCTLYDVTHNLLRNRGCRLSRSVKNQQKKVGLSNKSLIILLMVSNGASYVVIITDKWSEIELTLRNPTDMLLFCQGDLF